MTKSSQLAGSAVPGTLQAGNNTSTLQPRSSAAWLRGQVKRGPDTHTHTHTRTQSDDAMLA